MIIVLNGPLGIGKSTLAEALAERIDHCVMLDGDSLIAANPPPVDEVEFLHSSIALLVAHGRQFGYRHFVINHFWHTAAHLADLRARLLAVDPDVDIRCFLLTLPLADNLRRIELRQSARAINELNDSDRWREPGVPGAGERSGGPRSSGLTCLFQFERHCVPDPARRCNARRPLCGC
jgi:hypothetical protein